MMPFKEIFRRQKEYFLTDSTTSFEWRIDQLERLRRLLSDNHDKFLKAVGNDFKSSVYEQYFEVESVLGIIEATKSQLKGWMEPEEAPLPKFLQETGHRGIIQREPYGVALVMGPFNGPLILSLHPLVTVLSAGNTAILKMPEAIPATTSLLLELIPQYFDPACVAGARGGREEVNELLKLPFDFIFFTGSTPTGKVIARAAAENLTPVVLELGGQNPALVDETANLKDAAKKTVWGATAWGGQWCTSPGYAYVHESVVDEFVDEARAAVADLYGTDLRNNPDISKIVSPKEVSRLASLIEGLGVVAGGKFDVEERYFDPTVLYPVDWSRKIMDAEIFGPILPILTYGNLGEAIAEIKARPKPLSAYIFSRSQDNIDHFLKSVSFGGGAVNQTNVHLFIETMPFGGVGNSGLGSYYGEYGFKSLTHAKSLLISPPDVAIDQLVPPYTEQKIKDWTKWFEY